MQIHVVQRNESLTTIARLYHSTVNDIVEANDLPNPNNLVIGQAIVIPIIGQFYTVRQGDNLYTIGRRFGVTAQQLATVNRVSLNQPLKVGFRIYIPQGQKKRGEFNGYVEPRGTSVAPELERSAREAGPYLTYLAPFSFQARRDGTLKEPLLN